MPPFSRLRVSTLEDLAAQLRFAPRATVRRQLGAVLKLSAEIDPASAYAEDWVVRRITGYNPDIAEPAQLVGEALLGDLSAFIERVSAQSGLAAVDLPAGALDADALCAAWNVSRKTLERWRRRGLVGVRVATPAGQRLMFPLDSINSFAARHADVLARAASFERIDDATRQRILQRAARYRARLGLTLNQAASRLAPRFNLSLEGVRQLLQRSAGESHAPDFDDPKPLSGKRRALAFRAWRWGVPPAMLVKLLGKSRPAIRHAINTERSRRLRDLNLSGPISPRFDEPDAEQVLLASPLVREGLGRPGDTDVREFAALAAAEEPPDPFEESLRAEAYHFLRWRAAGVIEALHPRDPHARHLDEAETLLRWATLIKAELLRSHRAVILRAVEERAGVAITDLPSDRAAFWLTRAIASAAGAIDRYDPFKGGRLAAPVSFALGRTLAPVDDERTSGGVRSATAARRAHPASIVIDDWSSHLTPWQAWLDPLPSIRRAVEQRLIPEETARVIAARFGWQAGPPLTAHEIEARFGVIPSRLARFVREARRAAASAQ